MKIKLLLAALIASLFLTSCEGTSLGTSGLPSSIGKPYELLVVSDPAVWSSEVGDTIKRIFEEHVEMINEPEPLYDIISVNHKNITKVLKKHRNILDLYVDESKYEKTTMSAQFDALAKDQLFIKITSPSQDSLTNYIWENREVIIGMYDKIERDRFIQKASKFRSNELSNLVKEKFGFDIDIPQTYKLRNQKDDFLWISYELPLASLGFIIYNFDSTKDSVNLFNERDIAVKNVPGPSDGSYMKTDTTFMPIYNSAVINGQKWVEMKGFWNVKNDFMGGAFVNFTTQDPVTKRMIGVDCYVFSPSTKEGQRNYLRQLEALVLTIKFGNQQ